jgi:hypothetical protein
MIFDDDEKEKEGGLVSEADLGEVLEEAVEIDEDGEEPDPLMAEDEEKSWE